MSLPTAFTALTNATGAELDANFAALGALTTIPCGVSGANSITLTPNPNSPAITAYVNYQGFTGIATATNTSAAVANVGTLPTLPIYKDGPAGPVATSGGEIIFGNQFSIYYDSALNSGNGGFHLHTGGYVPNTARTQAAPSNPTAPASTSAFAMQGLAATITPTKTGRVLAIISGTIVSPSGTAAGLGILYQLSFGTGTPPVNAAAVTGTQVGPVQEYTNPAAVTAADVNVPFSIQFYLSGLTIGTAYWVDLAAKSVVTASDMGLANISVSLAEM